MNITQKLEKAFDMFRPHINGHTTAINLFLEALEEVNELEGLSSVEPPITLNGKPTDKLERGDVFLWQSGMTGRYEIHTFHSDAGYGAKTFTDYNEKDGSSLLVNYSGICGVLIGNDR